MKTAKRILFCLLLLILLLSLSGCFGGGSPQQGLLRRWQQGNPTAACFFYCDDTGELQTETLPADRLDELAAALDGMEYRTHSFHTDYFWFGTFGLELTLDDGNFWFYDGTEMQLRSVSILRSDDSSYELQSGFAEVVSCNFRDVLSTFFPSVQEASFRMTWGG